MRLQTSNIVTVCGLILKGGIRGLVMVFGLFVILAEGRADDGFESFSTQELKTKKEEITQRLNGLPIATLNNGVAPSGYRSSPLQRKANAEWAEINFRKPTKVDLVVIVPIIWMDRDGKYQADGFPKAFKVTARDARTGELHVIADYSDTSQLLPRYSPLTIPLESSIEISDLRIDALKPSRRAVNGDSIFQLAEFMAFHKDELVTLNQPVSVSSEAGKRMGWDKKYLVDGITPYVMNAAQGKSSRPFISRLWEKESEPLKKAIIDFHLPEAKQIDGIRIYAVEQRDTVPSSNPGDFGMPSKITLLGASDQSFAQPIELMIYQRQNEHETGPVLQRHFSTEKVSSIRLIADDLYRHTRGETRVPTISFSEVEILSEGKNILHEAEIKTSLRGSDPAVTPRNLIDGRNLYGNILPERQWLEGLSLRHDLVKELASLNLILTKRYDTQAKHLKLFGILLVLICFAFLIIFFWQKFHLLKQETAIRQRIASNLHDELGANLHAISHLGELIPEVVNEPEQLDDLITRLRRLTLKTGNAARDCSHMLVNADMFGDVVQEMERLNSQLLGDFEVHFHCPNPALINQLSRKKRLDLLLYYKECLANILRHSQATSVHVCLEGIRRNVRIKVTLDVEDNGTGLNGDIPSSLTRRARYLKGVLNSMSPLQGAGSLIRLTFSQFSLFPKSSKPTSL
ncbi:MAG: sensor histidine kinase [Akkermansiaceae bacterium]